MTPRAAFSPVLDTLVVHLRDAGIADIVVGACGGVVVARGSFGLIRVRVDPARAADTYSRYASHIGVVDVWFDSEVSACSEPLAAASTDPMLPRQHNLWRHRVPMAWKATKGRSDLTVCVIDSGVREEPKLAGKVTARLTTVGGAQGAGSVATVEPGPWSGYHMHGTACASVISGSETGAGPTGIAPACSVASIRTLDGSGAGYQQDTLDAIEDAGRRGYRLVNVSIGGAYANPEGAFDPVWVWDIPPVDAGDPEIDTPGEGHYETSYYKLLFDYLDSLPFGGPLLVVSAGNDAYDEETSFTSPVASMPMGVAVVRGHLGVGCVSFERQDRPARYSTHGIYTNILGSGHLAWSPPAVAVSSPGAPAGWVSRYGHAHTTSSGSVVFDWSPFNGTSSAAPNVCGCAALALSANMDLTRAQLRDVMLRTVDKPQNALALEWFRGPKYGVAGIGTGVANAEKAVLLATALIPANAGRVYPYIHFFGALGEVTPAVAAGEATFKLHGPVLMCEVGAISTDTVTEVELWAGSTLVYGPAQPRTSWGASGLLPVSLDALAGASTFRVVARTATASDERVYTGFTIDVGPWPRAVK